MFNTNELVVGGEESKLLYKKDIAVEDMHWISGHKAEFPLKCMVRIRHRQPLQPATYLEDNKIIFEDPQRAATPGQFAVVYKDDICLGGGIIK